MNTIPTDDIQRTVHNLADYIAGYYKYHKITEIVAVPVLQGAMPFWADLSRDLHDVRKMRNLNLKIRTAPVAARSYVGMTRKQHIHTYWLTAGLLRGTHVLIVEDIVDSGATLKMIQEQLETFGVASIRSVALLNKDARLEGYPDPSWSGFLIDKYDFVVGYGLDHNGYHRELPYIMDLEVLTRAGNQ